MTSAQIMTVILKLTLWQGQTKNTDAELYAYYIDTYSAEYKVDPVIALAVAYRESNFDEFTVGKAREIGLFQLKRHTPATKGYDYLGRRALFDPNLNIMLGIRNLARAREVCHSNNPNVWLSIYNGVRKKNGHCVRSRYSRRVMETYRDIKKMEAGYGT